MKINWYPGHMKKTHELIEKNLKLVDCVIELLDARIPYSSTNPVFDALIGQKPRVIALNKKDLADDVLTKKWVKHYADRGITAVPINANTGEGIKALIAEVKNKNSQRTQKMERQNRINQTVRMMIIGIPNVGKSSLINKLAGRSVAKTGNRPGVTKGKQWVKLDKELELFDTPGILWPKIESDEVGLRLAYTGSIKDEILPIEDICLYFIRDIFPMYPNLFNQRFNISVSIEEFEPLSTMESIATRRGCIAKGKETDYHRAANLILDEFRKGKIGQMTLDIPEKD